MANEVMIRVKSRDQSAPGLKSAAANVEKTGTAAERMGEQLRLSAERAKEAASAQRRLGDNTQDATRKLGNATAATRRLARAYDELKRSADRADRSASGVGGGTDRSSGLLGRLAGVGASLAATGAEAGTKLGASIASATGSSVASALSATGPVGGIIIAALAVLAIAAGIAFSSAIAATISAGILGALGGGVLAAGIAAAMKSSKVGDVINGRKTTAQQTFVDPKTGQVTQGDTFETRASGGLKETAKRVVDTFATPFVDPLVRALELVNEKLGQVEGKAKAVAEKFAPLIDQLAPALIEMAERSWPGIEKALMASLPLLESFAQFAPLIGESISSFFSSISENGDDANLAFRMILVTIGILIEQTGRWISFLAGAFGGTVRNIVALVGGVIAVWNGVTNAIDRATGAVRNFLGASRLASQGGAVQDYGSSSGFGARGRATGGIAGGLTMVGERGRELVRLPQGSSVMNNGATERAMGGGSSGGGASVPITTVSGDVADLLIALLRPAIQRTGGDGSIIGIKFV